MTHKTFQALRYHTDIVRGEYLLYIYINIARIYIYKYSSILKIERCGFCIWKLIYIFTIPCCLYFLIRKGCAPSVDFFKKNQNFGFFFLIFRKWIRYLKYKQRPVKITSCEAFLMNTKIFEFKKKKLYPRKKNTMNKKPFLTILNLCTKFQSPRFNNNFFFSKPIRSPQSLSWEPRFTIHKSAGSQSENDFLTLSLLLMDERWQCILYMLPAPSFFF